MFLIRHLVPVTNTVLKEEGSFSNSSGFCCVAFILLHCMVMSGAWNRKVWRCTAPTLCNVIIAGCSVHLLCCPSFLSTESICLTSHTTSSSACSPVSLGSYDFPVSTALTMVIQMCCPMTSRIALITQPSSAQRTELS